MTETVLTWPDGRTETVRLDERLGETGSQGDVWSVYGHPGLAVKRLREPTRFDLGRRLDIMLGHVPDARLRTTDDVVRIAWPVARAYRPDSTEPSGYAMPRLDGRRYLPLERTFEQDFRARRLPSTSWLWYLHVAASIADLVDGVHHHGAVIGDLAPANIFVTPPGRVAFVDTDGWQITTGGQTVTCPFSREEYTPPELLNDPHVVREKSADHWALAVLIARLITLGIHPYAGIAPTGTQPFDEVSNVRSRRCWLLGDRMRLPQWAPDAQLMPERLRALMHETFEAGYLRPDRRPTAGRWVAELSHVLRHTAVRTCTRNDRHFFPTERSACPWCAINDRAGIDRFPQVRR
jgi:DNA-binding helix-hairpin-helix protein with protein kinase domain